MRSRPLPWDVNRIKAGCYRAVTAFRLRRPACLEHSTLGNLTIGDRVSLPALAAQSQVGSHVGCSSRLVRVHRLRKRRVPSALAISLGALLSVPVIFGQQTAPGFSNGQRPAADSSSVSAALPQAPAPQSTGSIVGTVFDSNGDVLQGVRVTLTNRATASASAVESGSNGEFSFPGLLPGTYRITVTGAGMGVYMSPDLTLDVGQVRFVSKVILPVASASTEVRVTADRDELAEEQVHIAIDQRVLGVLPNFYTSFDWNAPAMGSKQKFQLAFRSVIDPVSFLGAGVLAGVEQANNTYPGYGQEAMGFTKRFGAAYANDFTGRMLSSAIFPSLFHQDPRYFYRGKGSKVSRALYAISAAVITRSDDGRWQPNYSHVLGNFAAGGISNLYYPSADRGLSLTLANGLIETAGNAGNNLLREFVLKGLTSRGSGRP